jgi:hypothetical protein
MRIGRLALSVATLGALAVASPAHGQNAEASRMQEERGTGLEFGVGGGAAIPTSNDFDNAFKLGWMAQASVTVTPATIPVGFQIDGNFLRNKTEVTGLDVKNQIIAGTGNIVYKLKVSEETKFRPYIIAGGGVYNIDLKGNDVPVNTSSTTKFGVNGGAGFDFKAASIGVFVEGRFHDIFTDGPNTALVNVTGGIRFGGR